MISVPDLDLLVPPPLISSIVARYALRPTGMHGVGHWARVLEIGLHLAERTGANRDVVALFAIFHDSCRINDGSDPGHGSRGAELALELIPDRLSAEEMDLLVYACAYHTDGLTEGDVTVRTCWDADRLDLGRVGIRPRAKYLCTDAGREPGTIEWADRRAVAGEVPAYVGSQWLAGESA